MDWRAPFRKAKPPQAQESCGRLPQRLLEAIAPLMGDRRPEVPETFLPTTNASDLGAIDQRLRACTSTAYATWAADTLQCILTCPMTDDARQSLLFVASAHYDGRERQKAVARLGAFPGYLSLVAALIRCADWVPQVRIAAREAATQLLRTSTADDALAAWPMVLRLQRWVRVSDGWLEENVEQWMLEASNRDVLQRARAAADPVVRAWAYRRSIERGAAPLHVEATMQPDPRIGLHALRHAQATCASAAIAAIATAGLHAPHPAVRRECLRTLALADPAAAAAALPHALLDRAAGVRRLAAYLTREHGADPRTVWRRALDQAGTDGALASLAQEAEPEDATRLRCYLFATRAAMRQHALKGLLRIGQTVSPNDIGRLLQCGGGRVLETLAVAVRDSAIALDTPLILHILGDAAVDDEGRARLRKLVGTSSLWDCLTRLLALPADSNRPWWLAAVDDWIGRSETYTPLGNLRKRTLLEAAAERAGELGPERTAKIRAALLRY
ncbi:hypothetical protein [Xanthomonas sacchari]|uniref:hypothetical protein n=1 Tax=Xanthomonas sacchari TaxID=56458 RepID=UPI0020C56407|nr:hypothetical protein [Xanthomonas sacchari]